MRIDINLRSAEELQDGRQFAHLPRLLQRHERPCQADLPAKLKSPNWSLEAGTLLSFPPCPASSLLPLGRVASLVYLLGGRWRIGYFRDDLR